MSVRLENLTLGYDRHPAVHHLTAEFPAGALVAIAGPNGAGKSTLLKGIAGILPPQEGAIHIPPGGIAYLPQAAEMARDFPLTVLQMVSTGFLATTGNIGSIDKTLRAKAALALARVGLSEFEHRPMSTLSAGQFQRMRFARLLVQDAALMLLDEPFASVDSATTTHLIEIIQAWHREGRTILVVLHDLEQIKTLFTHCLLLARECIASGAAADVLTHDNLKRAQFFHEAWNPKAEVCQA